MAPAESDYLEKL